MILPLNRETEKLYYNQRVIIDNNVLTEPRAWKISKVNRLAANGTLDLTFAQDRFDPHKDYIELDDDGNVVGMWADYYRDSQNLEETKDEYSSISYSGTKPELKVGGSYKKFTVNILGNDSPAGSWSFEMDDGSDATEYIQTLPVDGHPEQIKVKFTGDDSFIGRYLVVYYNAGANQTRLEIGIVSL